MLGEIAEQPAMFARILADRTAIGEVAAAIAKAQPRFVLLSGSGHERPRGSLREVPAGDPAQPAGRACLTVDDDPVRGPARTCAVSC